MEVDVGTEENCDKEKMAGRYFFNKDTSKCEKFNYTGCGGNKNNFMELQECRISCKYFVEKKHSYHI
jgi:hypothetical protein